MIRLSYVFALTFICFGNVLASAQPLDFAFGALIDGSTNNTLYRLTLPHAVYRNVTRADLGDIAVFNSKGDVVPFLLREAPLESATKKALVTLPFFPISASHKQNLDDFSLRVEKTTTGSITEVRSAQATPKDASVVSYILDGSQLSVAIAALIVDWQDKGENYIGQISVEGSDDLKHWHSLAADAVISRLSHAGQRLEQKRIKLPDTNAKYFRLSWPSNHTPLILLGVAAEPAPVTPPTPIQWLILTAKKTETPNNYEFDTQGFFPIQRLKINFPQDNSEISAKISTRADAKQPWQQIYQGRFYTLRVGGQRFNNNELLLNKTSNRYWRMELPEDTSINDVPSIEAGWRPHELNFIARGNPPYRIAFGSTRRGPSGSEQASLQSLMENTKLTMQTAQVGPAFNLGGADKLKPPPSPLPWKTWVLWTVLVGGVGLMAWMAIRLIKQMEN